MMFNSIALLNKKDSSSIPFYKEGNSSTDANLGLLSLEHHIVASLYLAFVIS